MDIAALTSDLQRDEGLRLVLYDDDTGKPLNKGDAIKGNPTLGYGWAVCLNPLTPEQYLIILGWQRDAKLADLARAMPWLSSMPENVQRAVANMAFELGVHGLQEFTTFLGLLQAGQYVAAATDLRGTPWYTEAGVRAARVCALIEGGTQV